MKSNCSFSLSTWLFKAIFSSNNLLLLTTQVVPILREILIQGFEVKIKNLEMELTHWSYSGNLDS